MENTNEGDVVELQDEVATLEEATKEEQDTTDWKAKYEEAQGKLRRAETKLEKTKIEKKAEQIIEKKSGELNETELDFLDLKGVTDESEIDLIHNVMRRTGQTVRQALKDEYVVEKLAKLRKEREVRDATPSETRRAGGAGNDVDYWLAKFDATGELPSDFKLRSEVINKHVDRTSTNKPAWHS